MLGCKNPISRGMEFILALNLQEMRSRKEGTITDERDREIRSYVGNLHSQNALRSELIQRCPGVSY